MSSQLDTAPSAGPLIEFRDVHKSFGKQQVLRGLNLEIPRGKVTCIIGASGTGKSVTLKHIVGLMKPDEGTILFDGRDITNMSRSELYEIRRRMGILFQEAALFDSMDVGTNVAFPLMEHTRLKREKIYEIVAEKLRIVGLEGVEPKMPSQLSGGMRKRVGLARALALDPEIVLFDEPTSGLDPIMTDAIDKLILSTQQHLGITALVITHDLTSMFRISDNIAMLFEGEIIAQGTPEEFAAVENPIVQQFLQGSSEGPVKVV